MIGKIHIREITNETVATELDMVDRRIAGMIGRRIDSISG